MFIPPSEVVEVEPEVSEDEASLEESLLSWRGWSRASGPVAIGEARASTPKSRRLSNILDVLSWMSLIFGLCKHAMRGRAEADQGPTRA